MTKEEFLSIQPGEIVKLNLQIHGLEGYSFGFVECVENHFGIHDATVTMFTPAKELFEGRWELINRWNLDYWEIAK